MNKTRGLNMRTPSVRLEFKKAAREMFFDRRKVAKSLGRTEKKVLNRFGARVRLRVRRSIRPQRRANLSEMTDRQQIYYYARMDAAKGKPARQRLQSMHYALDREEQEYYWAVYFDAKENGLPKAEKPFASSKPGEAPRSITGELRNNILYWYNALEASVTIGPVQIKRGGKIPVVLEHGGYNRKGQYIKKRPYMRPGLRRELPSLPSLWYSAQSGV